MNLLKANNLSHSFDTQLFSNISLELDSKQSLAIIGLSGSGKSSLLNILSTLLKPNEGEVYLFGKEVQTMKNKELEQIKRDKLGLVFQQHYLFRGLSVRENLEISSILSQQEIDMELLDKLGVKDKLDQNEQISKRAKELKSMIVVRKNSVSHNQSLHQSQVKTPPSPNKYENQKVEL